jgi:hypothetical protein
MVIDRGRVLPRPWLLLSRDPQRVVFQVGSSIGARCKLRVDAKSKEGWRSVAAVVSVAMVNSYLKRACRHLVADLSGFCFRNQIEAWN